MILSSFQLQWSNVHVVHFKPQFEAFNTYSLHCTKRKAISAISAISARNSGWKERVPKNLQLLSLHRHENELR